MKRLILILLVIAGPARAADISNPMALMFVGDRIDNIIDVVSLADQEVVHRIETSIHPDHIIATPFAPILIYTDIAARKASRGGSASGFAREMKLGDIGRIKRDDRVAFEAQLRYFGRPYNPPLARRTPTT